MKKIRLESELIKKIANELLTTTQSVRMALQFVYNSDKAKTIRKRAIELLRAEADEAEETEKLINK